MDNINQNIYKGLAISGLGIAVFTFIGLNPAYIILGFILCIPWLIVFLKKQMIKRDIKQRNNDLDNFKANARKVNGLILEYEIKTNNWTETEDVLSKYAWMNAAAGFSESNVKSKDIIQTAVLLKFSYENKTAEVVRQFGKQPETVMMLLEIHKNIIVYIDKTNPEYVYPELEFLDN